MCALVASPRPCPQNGATALDDAQQEGKTEAAELLRTWMDRAMLSDEEKGKRLYDAAEKGDMAGVTAALDLGAPVMWKNHGVSAESASLQ